MRGVGGGGGGREKNWQADVVDKLSRGGPHVYSVLCQKPLETEEL